MPDDDIIELTEVVKPGNMAGGGRPDFGADLDAMLNEFGDESAVPLPKASPAAPPAARTAKSFGEPDESGRLGEKPADGQGINPDEELELPELSDLDALLHELGVDDAPSPAAGSPAAPPQTVPQAAAQAAPQPAAISPDDDIETLMAGMRDVPAEPARSAPPASPAAPVRAAAPAPAATPAAVAAPASAAPAPPRVAATPPAAPAPVQAPAAPRVTAAATPLQAPAPAAAPVAPAAPAAVGSADDIDSLMADLNAAPVTPVTPPVAPAPSVQAAPPAASGEDQDIASILEDAEAALPEPAELVQPVLKPVAAAPRASAPAARPVEPVEPIEDDGIDMNQLDAMLDQVLAAAPKPRPAAAAAVTPAAPVTPIPPVPPVPQVPPVTPPTLEDPPLAAGAATALPIPEFGDIDVGAMLAEADAKQSVKPAPVIQDVGAMLAEAEAKQKVKPVITATARMVPPAKPRPASAAPAPAAPGRPAAGELTALKSENAELRKQLDQLQNKLSVLQADALKDENLGLREQLDKLQSEMSAWQTNMEKYAAKAAAKVIREEMAALLRADLE